MHGPSHAVFRNYGDALFVISGQYSRDFRMAGRVKSHFFSNAEVHHRRMGPHLPQKPQARDDLVIQLYEFLLGKAVNIDFCHAAPVSTILLHSIFLNSRPSREFATNS